MAIRAATRRLLGTAQPARPQPQAPEAQAPAEAEQAIQQAGAAAGAVNTAPPAQPIAPPRALRLVAGVNSSTVVAKAADKKMTARDLRKMLEKTHEATQIENAAKKPLAEIPALIQQIETALGAYASFGQPESASESDGAELQHAAELEQSLHLNRRLLVILQRQGKDKALKASTDFQTAAPRWREADALFARLAQLELTTRDLPDFNAEQHAAMQLASTEAQEFVDTVYGEFNGQPLNTELFGEIAAEFEKLKHVFAERMIDQLYFRVRGELPVDKPCTRDCYRRWRENTTDLQRTVASYLVHPYAAPATAVTAWYLRHPTSHILSVPYYAVAATTALSALRAIRAGWRKWNSAPQAAAGADAAAAAAAPARPSLRSRAWNWGAEKATAVRNKAQELATRVIQSPAAQGALFAAGQMLANYKLGSTPVDVTNALYNGTLVGGLSLVYLALRGRMNALAAGDVQRHLAAAQAAAEAATAAQEQAAAAARAPVMAQFAAAREAAAAVLEARARFEAVAGADALARLEAAGQAAQNHAAAARNAADAAVAAHGNAAAALVRVTGVIREAQGLVDTGIVQQLVDARQAAEQQVARATAAAERAGNIAGDRALREFEEARRIAGEHAAAARTAADEARGAATTAVANQGRAATAQQRAEAAARAAETAVGPEFLTRVTTAYQTALRHANAADAAQARANAVTLEIDGIRQAAGQSARLVVEAAQRAAVMVGNIHGAEQRAIGAAAPGEDNPFAEE